MGRMTDGLVGSLGAMAAVAYRVTDSDRERESWQRQTGVLD